MDSEQTYLSPAPNGGLYWGPLTEGKLVRRYKRFLADVELSGGEIITAHTANTGRMIGCSEPGRPVWLSVHNGAKRKYQHTLEMISMPTSLVGVNTMVPNKLTARAAEEGLLVETQGPCQVEREVKTGQSRLDLKLTSPGGEEIMVEVKNCTLAENGTAFFPDAVTARGSRHLEELATLTKAGKRAAVLILVQRSDAECFSPADHIDPTWGANLREAVNAGVEIWVYQATLSIAGISLGARLPVILP